MHVVCTQNGIDINLKINLLNSASKHTESFFACSDRLSPEILSSVGSIPKLSDAFHSLEAS